jgi:queuine/archaeosine tRNA-ribosyltransferase
VFFYHGLLASMKRLGTEKVNPGVSFPGDFTCVCYICWEKLLELKRSEVIEVALLFFLHNYLLLTC